MIKLPVNGTWENINELAVLCKLSIYLYNIIFIFYFKFNFFFFSQYTYLLIKMILNF